MARLSGDSPIDEVAKEFGAAMQRMSIQARLAWLKSTVPIYLGGGWSVQPHPEGNTFMYTHDANREFLELVGGEDTSF
jgi:hypothetical protein